MSVSIHESAIIDEGASIGKKTKIWHFTHIMSGAVVGANCTIGQNVYIDNNVVIGCGVKIQNNVSVFDGVTIGDDCFIGPSVVFTNVINPRAAVVRKMEFKATLLHKGVSIGANATLVCGVTLGEYAFVGAGAVVVRDVAPFSMVVGVPAKHVAWMSAFGEKLMFNNQGMAMCKGSGDHYELSEGRVKKIDLS